MPKLFDIAFYDGGFERIHEMMNTEAESIAIALALAAAEIPKIQGNAHIVEICVEEVGVDDEDDEFEIEEEEEDE